MYSNMVGKKGTPKGRGGRLKDAPTLRKLMSVLRKFSSHHSSSSFIIFCNFCLCPFSLFLIYLPSALAHLQFHVPTSDSSVAGDIKYTPRVMSLLHGETPVPRLCEEQEGSERRGFQFQSGRESQSQV